MTWPTEAPIEDRDRLAAIGCLRIASLMRRVGLESAWRFRPGNGRALDHVRALLDGGAIQAEVGFPADDLATAAESDEAASDLAQQAIEVWRHRSVKE